MEIIDNYLNYKKEKPNYKQWKLSQKQAEAKRAKYVSQNKIDDNQRQQDIKRAKAVLEAVDVMDDYSQTRAEDMENVVQSLSGIVSYGVIGVAAAGFGLTKLLAKNLNKKASTAIGAAVAFISGLSVFALYSQWAARKEVEASKNGRFEAMQKDLASPVHFAVLDENQEKELDEITKNTPISKKEAKKMRNATLGLGVLKSLKTLIVEDKNLNEAKKDFRAGLKEDESKFDSVELSEDEINEAKKDKQLITNIVEKIDVASQDYAENIELATGTIRAIGLGSGGLVSAGVAKILKKVGIAEDKRLLSSMITLLCVTIPFTFIATKLQKEGSRVARFKIKQDFLKNTDKLVYVDDEKTKDIKADEQEEEKKQNFLKFTVQALKDNKEYNEYKKNSEIAQKQRVKAKEQIKITPEQEKRAKQLQRNIFKMFNKLDEKSQSYSESTEALGETLQTAIAVVAMILPMFSLNKVMKNMDKIKTPTISNTFRTMLPMFKTMIFSWIPMIVFNVLITKEQKNASRVADMIAIKEMDDYRNFADYSNKSNKNSEENISNTKKQNFASAPVPPWNKTTRAI